MTNGEEIIAILKPRKDQIRIYGNWVEIEIQKLGINFSCGLDWWNAECNESTTKNDLGVDCIDRKQAQNKIKKICNTYGLSYEDGERKPATGGSAYALGHAFDDLPPVEPISKECIDCIAEDKTFIKMDRIKQLLNSCELDDLEVLKKISEVVDE